MKKKNYAVCQCCSKRAEYTECVEKYAPPEDARCAVLSGWLSVSHWKRRGVVDYYDFCSLSCLQTWVDSKMPKVPEVFREAFERDKPSQ